MAAYASRKDLVTRFGEEEIVGLEDPDNTGAPDENVSAAALQDATEEADSYVAVRYALPLPAVPAPLSRAVCDIARFRLYKSRPTEEVKYRYERTVKWLEALTAGKVLLNFEPALTPVQEEANHGIAAVGTTYEGGVFANSTLDKMPTIEKAGGYPGGWPA